MLSFLRRLGLVCGHSYSLVLSYEWTHSLWQCVSSTECDLVLPLFNFQYPLFSFRPCGSSLRLFTRLPVTSIIPSIGCSRRRSLCSMWPIQLAFLLFIVRRRFLFSLTLCNTSFFTRSAQTLYSILHQHHISKLVRYFWSALQSAQVSVPYKAMLLM